MHAFLLGLVLALALPATTVPAAAILATEPTLISATVPAATASARPARLPSKAVWLHDVRVAMKPAIPYLEQRVKQGGGSPAIVLDIDNTSLATHYAWPRPVKATLAFARRAHALGVKVFFVTGRMQADALAQRATLRRAGYSVDGICGRRKGESLVTSKTRCRRAIAARGFTIIASVGNRTTDFKGGLTGRRFKLPSYGGLLS